jgi:ketosteroid isomerase-like protein
MKTATGLICVLLLGTLIPLRSSAQTAGGVAQTITHLEQQWAKAQAAGKPEVVAPMLADEFITIGTDGKLTGKQDLLSHLKPGHWEQNEISDVKVIVRGDTAVATGLWTGKGVMGQRKIDLQERWTDTWVRTSSGQWQCLASQQTEIKR